jgi:hypothetical protein
MVKQGSAASALESNEANLLEKVARLAENQPGKTFLKL